eukprot:2406657-Ditylum_brightwellii.AAC.1
MITEHTAAVIIQTRFCLTYQQCILYKNNDAFNEWGINNEYINERKEDNDNCNALFSSFIFDADNTIKDFATQILSFRPTKMMFIYKSYTMGQQRHISLFS